MTDIELLEEYERFKDFFANEFEANPEWFNLMRNDQWWLDVWRG